MSDQRRILDIQLFTERGTWHKPPGTTEVKVIAWPSGAGQPGQDGKPGAMLVISYGKPS